jgi:hypothetical protein
MSYYVLLSPVFLGNLSSNYGKKCNILEFCLSHSKAMFCYIALHTELIPLRGDITYRWYF